MAKPLESITERSPVDYQPPIMKTPQSVEAGKKTGIVPRVIEWYRSIGRVETWLDRERKNLGKPPIDFIA